MTADPTVLRVALPVPLPRLFDYLPPTGATAEVLAAGQRLRVPFGGREMVGILAGHGPAEAGVELRRVLEPLDATPLLDGELLASLRWLAGYLHAPLGEVLATALPAALRRGEPLPDTTAFGWQLGEAGRTALLLNGNEGGARRWRDWMVSEGFEALALAESAQAATDWIANRHD